MKGWEKVREKKYPEIEKIYALWWEMELWEWEMRKKWRNLGETTPFLPLIHTERGN